MYMQLKMTVEINFLVHNAYRSRYEQVHAIQFLTYN